MSTETIRIRLNGEPHDMTAGTTISALMASLDIRADRVAVELNRSIVKQNRWAETVVPPDSELEIVQFVGGG